jgi:hypothetical protein
MPEPDSTATAAGTEGYNPSGFGWFFVESGVRYVLESDSDTEEDIIFDFQRQ